MGVKINENHILDTQAWQNTINDFPSCVEHIRKKKVVVICQIKSCMISCWKELPGYDVIFMSITLVFF